MRAKPRIETRNSTAAGLLGRQRQPWFTLLAHGPFLDAPSSPRITLKLMFGLALCQYLAGACGLLAGAAR